MKTTKDLTREELEKIVEHIHEEIYYDDDEKRWDAGKSVHGADFFDVVVSIMEVNGMVPEFTSEFAG